MEKASCYDKNVLKKGAWTEEEDNKLRAYIQRYGHWNWGLLPKFAGVSRSGKSCRLRWMNYLRPNMKHGNFTEEEDDIIVDLRNKIGNKWSAIAAKLPGRSDNEVKNRWNTHLKKRVMDHQDLSASANIGSAQPDDQAYAKVNTHEHQQEVDRLLGQESSKSPSSSSSTGLSSCWLNEVIDCRVSSNFIPQSFVDEMAGDLWNDPFLQDNNNNIVPSGENLFSPFNYVNDFNLHSSSQDMIMNDEFLWPTIDTYVEDIWNS